MKIRFQIYYLCRVMLTKRIFALLICGFVTLIFTNGFAKSMSNEKRVVVKTHSSSSISKDVNSGTKENISAIEGALQLLIKVKNNSNNTFRNAKDNKKRLNAYLFKQSLLFSKTCYTFYCSERVNKISVSPLYISYRSLII